MKCHWLCQPYFKAGPIPRCCQPTQNELNGMFGVIVPCLGNWSLDCLTSIFMGLWVLGLGIFAFVVLFYFVLFVYIHVFLDLFVCLFVLKQWFSTFLMLQPFNTVIHIMVSPNHKIISLPLHHCNFSTVMNGNVNIWYAGYLIHYPKGLWPTGW